MNKKLIAQIEPWIGEEEKRAVVKVLESGWITEADKTQDFEQAVAEFTGARYAHAVSNGTVSLYIALKALDVGVGDEVIVPDFTMVASPNSIVMAGATPVFVDIDKKSLCLKLDHVEKKITDKTKAIMPVAVNGRAPNMDHLKEIAKMHDLFIIEDAAQALGCYYKGKHLGTFGEIGSFSFSTPKIITTGQGGILVTNDKNLSEKIVRLKDFGRINRDSQDHDEIGFNFKFTDIQAVLGVEQMKKLPDRLKRKKEMFGLYQQNLRDVADVLFLETDLEQTSPWFIDIIVPDPELLQVYLKENNIGTRLFYPAIHKTRAYRSKEKYPNSLWASRHGLWLPSSSFLSDSDINYVCAKIREFYE